MSEMEENPNRPTGPVEPADAPYPAPDHSLLPPPPPAPAPPPYWAPGPPLQSTAPAPVSVWHKIAAGVALAAVVAAAAGVGIGWTLARSLEGRGTTQLPLFPEQSSSQPLAPQSGSGTSLSASQVAARVEPALVVITTELGNGSAAGTGMIVTSSGEVLTNNHVIDGSTSIQVTVQGGHQYSAHLVATDPSADVALIKLEGASGLSTVTFGDSSSLKVGDSIIAIGNALGQGIHVTQGSVTALDQTITASEGGGSSEQLTGMVQTDATIYEGDSGGALVNSSAQVVGMITAGEAQGFRASGSTVGYAVSSASALRVVNRIRAGEEASDLVYGQVGYLGVSVESLDSFTAAQLGVNVTSGALVRSVLSGLPAQQAGITSGDVITNLGGTAVTDTDSLGTAVKAHKPGDHVSITWVNSGGTHTATVILAGVN